MTIVPPYAVVMAAGLGRMLQRAVLASHMVPMLGVVSMRMLTVFVLVIALRLRKRTECQKHCGENKEPFHDCLL
jgi:cation transport ATPase